MPDKPSSVRELAEENKTLKERLDLIEKVNKGQTDWKNINEDSLRVQKEAGRLNLQHLESQAELLARQGRMVEAAEKLKELETELIIHGTGSTRYDEAEWWKKEEGLIMVNNEYVKLLYYELKY